MRFIRFSLLLIFSWLSSAAYAELVLFPMLDAVKTEGDAFDVKSIVPAATIFYSEETDSFSVLAEAVISEDKQNLERFQIGFKLSPTNTLWLGRGHTPYGYWNTQFHHGSYFQNSISAPNSISGDLFNRHLTGLEWESEFYLANQTTVKFEYMAGFAPSYDGELNLTTNMLERGKFVDFDLLDPNANQHDIGQTMRLSYNGFNNPENSFGIFFSDNKYKAASEFKQKLSGTFLNLQGLKWRLLGEYYWVENAINQAHDIRYGWLQTEYNREKLTWFARYEESYGDMYSFLCSPLVEENYIVGLRFDFAERQALKIEFSQVREAENQLRLEWSGYIK